MQNKGAIKLFAIALTLVSIYQLSFTWISNMVKSDAKEYAKGDPKKEINYLDSISGEGVYNFLWIRDYTYKETQERELNLGLDLKGGMNVTLEVSTVDLVRSMANYSGDSTFVKAIGLAQKKQKNSQEDFVTLFGQAFQEIDPNAKLSAIFATRELKDRINFNSTNKEVLEIIRKETKDAIDNSFNILRSRIDRFGVTQPNIQLLGNSGRILVELPGIKEPERVRKLLQGTANLEFWETFDNKEVFDYLRNANERLKTVLGGKEIVDSSKTLIDTTKNVAKNDKNVNNKKKDSSLILSKDTTSLLSQLDKDTLNKGKTTNETDAMRDFQKQNPLFAILRPSVNQQGNLLPGSSIGIAHFKDTALVNSYLKMKQIKEIFPRELKFLWEVKPVDAATTAAHYQLVAIKVTNRDGIAALGGNVITNARAEFGENKASAEVTMTMNAEGAKTWARLTKENIGRQIAIVLDNYVYSAPVVNGEIRGGNSQISGNFTIQEAKDLANILKSGKMPAPARIVEEEVVGPSLGKESVDASLISFVLAFLLVLVYMIFFYNKAGIVANVALIVNVLFIFGVLSSLGAVLTLPGIAGIVLTLGMAVDANVLIYERIIEEVNAGKGLRLAITDGFRHAMTAIIDSNLTTLLTGVILYIFGTGPIQGFATTLCIGILTSMFTAIFISRLILLWFLDRNKEITFTSKITSKWLANVQVDFLGKRKYFYIISGLVILIGIGSMFTRGFNLGIDFKGGRTYVVRFDQEVKTSDVQDALKGAFDGVSSEVKTFGPNNQVKIATKFLVDENKLNVDSIIENRLFKALGKFYKTPLTLEQFSTTDKVHGILSSQRVGPTIADDIKRSAFYAIIFALIGIFIYVFVRFKNWRMGVGGIVSLAHDVLLVLGIYSLFYSIMPFSLEIDQAFIAAILTIIGYSINDTVVVYDRIREYLNMGKRWERKETYNRAMSSTLRRTLNTSITTLVTVIAMFIFGGEVIRGFLFALLIGIGTGTYSSIFIATSIVYDTDKAVEKFEDKKVVRGNPSKKAKDEPIA